jgi:hypothetical protein
MPLDDDNPLYLIRDAGHSPASVARLFEVHPRTVRRWIDQGRMPRAAQLHLEFLAGRNPDWEGFRFRGPYVITPIGKKYHAQQVLSIDWMIRQLGLSLKKSTAKAGESPRSGDRATPGSAKLQSHECDQALRIPFAVQS